MALTKARLLKHDMPVHGTPKPNFDARIYWATDFLSSAGTGKKCALSLSLYLSMRLSNPSLVLDKNRAPMGPEIISNTGAGVWRKAPKPSPDSSSVLDEFQSVIY